MAEIIEEIFYNQTPCFSMQNSQNFHENEFNALPFQLPYGEDALSVQVDDTTRNVLNNNIISNLVIKNDCNYATEVIDVCQAEATVARQSSLCHELPTFSLQMPSTVEKGELQYANRDEGSEMENSLVTIPQQFLKTNEIVSTLCYSEGSTNKNVRLYSKNPKSKINNYKNGSTRHNKLGARTANGDKAEKPPYTYISLIAKAIQAQPSKKATLAEIYQHLRENYDFFRGKYVGWKNSIRHNLSIGGCFKKLPKLSGSAGGGAKKVGKGHQWAIGPELAFDGKQQRRSRPSTTLEETDCIGGKKFIGFLTADNSLNSDVDASSSRTVGKTPTAVRQKNAHGAKPKRQSKKIKAASNMPKMEMPQPPIVSENLKYWTAEKPEGNYAYLPVPYTHPSSGNAITGDFQPFNLIPYCDEMSNYFVAQNVNMAEPLAAFSQNDRNAIFNYYPNFNIYNDVPFVMEGPSNFHGANLKDFANSTDLAVNVSESYGQNFGINSIPSDLVNAEMQTSNENITWPSISSTTFIAEPIASTSMNNLPSVFPAELATMPISEVQTAAMHPPCTVLPNELIANAQKTEMPSQNCGVNVLNYYDYGSLADTFEKGATNNNNNNNVDYPTVNYFNELAKHSPESFQREFIFYESANNLHQN